MTRPELNKIKLAGSGTARVRGFRNLSEVRLDFNLVDCDGVSAFVEPGDNLDFLLLSVLGELASALGSSGTTG